MSDDKDKLEFNGSPEPTIGIELELPIIDRQSRELAPGAPRILDACRQQGIDCVGAELMQSMLEVQTGACRNVRELREQLVPRLHRVRNLCNSAGYDLALLASHPSAKPNEHVITSDERYERQHGRMAWMIYHRVTFGLHVHIGVQSGDQAIGLINMMVQRLPHLIAVSGNSPYWQGIDSGLVSARCALYNLVIHSGVPQYFSTWRDFRNYVKVLRECKAMSSVTDLKWDIRPRPDLGTIEVRACDTPTSLRHVFAIAALIRTLVISTQRLVESRPDVRQGDIRWQWITQETRWLATRYGLDAIYIRTPGGKRSQLRQDLAELLERLEPTARETGDDRYLRYLLPVDRLETGAEVQRRLYHDTGDWKSIVDHAVTQLNRDIEQLMPAPAARAG